MKLSRLHFFFVLLASFIALTLIYFRCTLFMPVNYLITRHQGTDTYIYMMNAQNFVNWLKHDFIPIGSYWVPHGGGFPATAHARRAPVCSWGGTVVRRVAAGRLRADFRRR